MPPLPRRPTATDPNLELPPLPNAANNNSNNSSSSKYGAPVANGNGVANNNGNSNNNAAAPMQWGSFGLPSALSSAMDTSAGTSVMGTSVGSKTPSTGRSILSSSTISKRFTSFAGGPRERSGSSSSSGSSSLMNRPGGPGVVSFKALRTGSATANVELDDDNPNL
ncbi:hypothetical protein FRC17_005480 [Serendipita sp. 399]|nr:hypothetical protein FRC17_005480 [Serendipita sp. 399]